MLTIPVLAGSTAYPIAELFGWREGMGEKPAKAPGFYGVMALAMLVGLGLGFVGINPMDALFYSAVLQGLLAPFLVGLITHMASSRRIVQPGPVSGWFERGFGGLTAGITAAAALAMLILMA